MQNTTIKGAILFTGAMLISSSIGIFVQNIDTTAINIVFFRCLLGSIFLGCYVLTFKRQGFVKCFKEIKYIVICALLLVLNWVFLFASFKHASISVAVSIYYLAPIFIMLYGILKMGECVTTVKIIGILIAFLGAVLVSGAGSFANTNLYGVLYALLAALFYAALVIVAKNIKQTPAAHTAFIQTLIGAIVLFMFIDLTIADIQKLDYKLIIIIGLVHTAIMYVLFFNGVKYSSIGMVALLGFIDPLFAVILDNVVLNTTLSILQWLGIILIMGAITLKIFVEKK